MNGHNIVPAMLARPDYIELDERNRIANIFCKVCGEPIAVSRSAQMKRLKNYCEIKIKFEDTTCHVTNICRGCVPKAKRHEEILMAIYYADIADMMRTGPHLDILLEGKTKPRIVTVDTSQMGIK